MRRLRPISPITGWTHLRLVHTGLPLHFNHDGWTTDLLQEMGLPEMVTDSAPGTMRCGIGPIAEVMESLSLNVTRNGLSHVDSRCHAAAGEHSGRPGLRRPDRTCGRCQAQARCAWHRGTVAARWASAGIRWANRCWSPRSTLFGRRSGRRVAGRSSLPSHAHDGHLAKVQRVERERAHPLNVPGGSPCSCRTGSRRAAPASM